MLPKAGASDGEAAGSDGRGEGRSMGGEPGEGLQTVHDSAVVYQSKEALEGPRPRVEDAGRAKEVPGALPATVLRQVVAERGAPNLDKMQSEVEKGALNLDRMQAEVEEGALNLDQLQQVVEKGALHLDRVSYLGAGSKETVTEGAGDGFDGMDGQGSERQREGGTHARLHRKLATQAEKGRLQLPVIA